MARSEGHDTASIASRLAEVWPQFADPDAPHREEAVQRLHAVGWRADMSVGEAWVLLELRHAARRQPFTTTRGGPNVSALEAVAGHPVRPTQARCSLRLCRQALLREGESGLAPSAATRYCAGVMSPLRRPALSVLKTYRENTEVDQTEGRQTKTHPTSRSGTNCNDAACLHAAGRAAQGRPPRGVVWNPH